MQLPDSLRRGIRTFGQGFVGVITLQAGAIVLDVQKGEWVPDVNWLQRVAVSAVAAGVIATFSYIQNALEDSPNIRFPAVLKASASSGVNPVTNDPARP